MRTRALAVLAAALVAAGAVAVAERSTPRRIRVAHVVEAFEAGTSGESPDSPLVAFDPGGDLVVVCVIRDATQDLALAWRRIGADGAASPATRVDLPSPGTDLNVFLQAVAVGADGTTSVAFRTSYTDPDEGFVIRTSTEILRIAADGTPGARFSLGGDAQHVVLADHGGFLHVAYDTPSSLYGVHTVYWRGVTAAGALTGPPVAISDPLGAEFADANRVMNDVFLGVDGAGTARVIHDWEVTTSADGTLAHGVAWRSVTEAGVASAAVALPVEESDLRAAFAPDGSACVVSSRGAASLAAGSTFPPPLAVAPDGSSRPTTGLALPPIVVGSFGVGADAEGRFHAAAFATDALRAVHGKFRHVLPSFFAGTIDAAGGAHRWGRVFLPARSYRRRGITYRSPEPSAVSAHVVAADGTTALAGRTVFGSAEDQYVVADFLSSGGGLVGHVRFPKSAEVGLPVLAAGSADGRARFAAAWTERPAAGGQTLTVAIFE